MVTAMGWRVVRGAPWRRSVAISLIVALGIGTSSAATAPTIENPAKASAPASRVDSLLAWSLQIEFAVPFEDGIACADATHCVAMIRGVGQMFSAASTSDGWRTSTTAAIPFDISDVHDVRCPSTTRCLAAISDASQAGVIVSSDGGITWQGSSGIPPSVEVKGITCFSDVQCIAAVVPRVPVGEQVVVLQTDDAGASWIVRAQNTDGSRKFDAIDCVDATVCFATGSRTDDASRFGSTTHRSDDGGMTWSPVDELPSVIREELGILLFDEFVLSSVSCATALVCVTAGLSYSGAGSRRDSSSLVRRTEDGGITWVTQSIGLQDVSDVACVTATTCYAAGRGAPIVPGRSFLFSTGPDGRTWEPTPIATPYGGGADRRPLSFSGLSCPSPTTCFAIGMDLVAGVISIARTR